MIREVRLRHFKGFEQFTLRLGRRSVLVGPNNAGKSSLISAIRAIAGMRQRAARETPSRFEHEGGIGRRGWTVPHGYGLNDENLRYDFLDRTVEVTSTFGNGAQLRAIWPGSVDRSPDDVDWYSDPFFHLLTRAAEGIHTIRNVRDLLPTIGNIPILTPIDQHESVRARETVLRNLSGRLASRHFRNQLLLLDSERTSGLNSTRFEQFLDFAEPWLDGIRIDKPVERRTDSINEIDVFYYERRRARELAWAGDGFQVFLQLLYHLFRLQDADSVVLDEPDVYLHADLQRRFYQVVDAQPGQVIFSTHSSELVAEVPPDAVIWVDRTRRRSVASPDPRTLEDLSNAIGSSFNLRLARILRSKVVLFVEGEDATLLRLLARTLSARQILSEASLAVVSLGGISNRRLLESFGWVADNMLEGAVKGYVLLDSDYRPIEICRSIEHRLREFGLYPHVWRRKELESYLLETAALARAVGTTEGWVDELLAAESVEMKHMVHSRIVNCAYEEREDRSVNLAAVTQRVDEEFDAMWTDPVARRWRSPAKELLAAINRQAQADNLRTITSHALARELRKEEIAQEVAEFLGEVNDAAGR